MQIADLTRLYSESDECDKQIFQEQRSNILLVAGDHYTRRNSRFWGRIRDSKKLSNEQKLRLVKNHVQKVTKTYVSNLLTQAPGVTAVPYNEKQLSDQKQAEMHNAVLADCKQKQKVPQKVREFATDFVNIGEVAAKVYFDPHGGNFLGYEDELQTLPVEVFSENPEENGETSETENNPKPIFSGEVVIERVFTFNLLRAREAKSMHESRYLIYRKMVDIADLKAMYAGDDEKLKMITESSYDTFTVFEGSNGNYQNTKDQAMIREFYFRPCLEYPNGYFYISTENGILEEGELPFGIFPIRFQLFDEIQTSPRGRSIIKVLRPYQAEINRTASTIATHQIVLGDDKIIYQTGTKLAPGGQLPGIRGVQYSGIPPQILPGRTGAQYLDYLNAQIAEMYSVANLELDSEEKVSGQIDPYSMLFRSIKQKKKFVPYAEKFEEFLVDVFETYLKLKKKYVREDELIKIVGKKEYVNIAEFKQSDDLSYHIKVEPRSDDLETQMGKQLTFNHILQYVGPQLSKDDIGMIVSQMPFGNSDQAYRGLTVNWDNARNSMLALDRGQFVPARKYDDHPYMIKELSSRMKEPDFEFLDPHIQNLYEQKIQQHEQAQAETIKLQQAAEAGFIPSGGYLVVCDFYVTDPKAPEKTRRARVPYESLKWLIDRLETQGTNLQQLEGLESGALSDMARMILKNSRNVTHEMPQPSLPA